jgi:hypothetical protein
MFRSIKFFAVLAIFAAVFALPLFRSTATGNMVAVIVELHDDPAAVYKARTERAGGSVSQEALMAYRNSLSSAQDSFLSSLASNGIIATVISRDVADHNGNPVASVPLRYTLVYNGMALKVDRSQIAALKAMPQVKSVHRDERLYTNLNKSVPYTRAPEVYGNYAELTPFDNLNEGYEGQGMYVSVIDTGIDWTHPMFGADPHPPRLAVIPPGGTQGQFNTKVVYSLPLDDLGAADGFGHGTHVAATVAGYLSQTLDGVRLYGMAPQAKLMSYKVCSDIRSTVSQVQPIGGCDSSNIIMALEDSVSPFTLNNPLLPKPVAHVINMSLGGGGGPDNPTAIAASNAALTGTVVVAASGNSGPGEGTTGSPAAGTHVISVGATTHPGSAGSVWSTDVLQSSAFPTTRVGRVTPASGFPAAQGFDRIKLFPMSGSAQPPAASMAQYYVYVDNPTGPWPTAVNGRIALVNRSGSPVTPFAYVANMAAASGAVGVIFVSATQNPTGVTSPIPAANIAPADAQVLVSQLSSPTNGSISTRPIRINPVFSDAFMGEMAGFSSRGPVRGFGQIKPDVSAPGVSVLAAVPPASLLGALAVAANPLTPNYIAIDGTSMASPHTAGAAAQIKQAHLNWSPDVIRTVLINTATNMRDLAGGAKPDGLTADNIISQGGGLIDVSRAVNAKAIMGVTGDGINTPGILGSHSFGEVPVANSRVTSTQPVTVTVRDLSGQGGTYSLGIANNRDLQLAGINVSTSQSSVSVPANGTATFTVNATFDGDLIRDVIASKTIGTQTFLERIQMQWFVTAQGNGQSLRMPFYFRPGFSLPAEPTIEDLTQTALVPAADAGVQTLSGATFVDVPFQVSASTYQIDVNVDWFSRPTGAVEDIDYQLYGPDGTVVASSGNAPGQAESVSVRVTKPGTYKHRLVGYANAATDVTVRTRLSKGPNAPAAQPIQGEFANAQGQQVDFNGSFTLNWTPAGGEQSYEIERSSNGGTSWETVAAVNGSTTSYAFSSVPNGTYSFRVRGLHPGQIGKYVTNGSNAVTIQVDTRSIVDITNLVSVPISNISLSGGVWQHDARLVNNSSQTFLPLVDVNIVRIQSASGTVRVINADNGKSGVNAANAALFSYSSQLGSDQQFSPAETSGARTMRFQNNASELFTYDAVVTAYVSSGGGAGAAPQGAPAGGGSSAPASGPDGLLAYTRVLRVTVNPLTQTTSVSLIGL